MYAHTPSQVVPHPWGAISCTRKAAPLAIPYSHSGPHPRVGLRATVAEVGKWVQRARVWPLLNAAAFALNVVAVSLPGRIDGKYAETKGMPRDDEYRGLVTPAGWAFALWGLIYTSEAASVVYQGWVADKAPAWMAAASPGWIAANLFQALWCAAFRPWARPLASFWLTPLLLSSVAVSLSFSQVRVKQPTPPVPPSTLLSCNAAVITCLRHLPNEGAPRT